MLLKKLMLDFLEEEIHSINVEQLFREVLEQDLINRGALFAFVEAVYYLQVILDKPDRDLMGSFYELIGCDDHKFTKTNYLYIIMMTDYINKKSVPSIYG